MIEFYIRPIFDIFKEKSKKINAGDTGIISQQKI